MFFLFVYSDCDSLQTSDRFHFFGTSNDGAAQSDCVGSLSLVPSLQQIFYDFSFLKAHAAVCTSEWHSIVSIF